MISGRLGTIRHQIKKENEKYSQIILNFKGAEETSKRILKKSKLQTNSTVHDHFTNATFISFIYSASMPDPLEL